MKQSITALICIAMFLCSVAVSQDYYAPWIHGQEIIAKDLYVGAYQGPANVTISLAASSTTDGMDITVTATDSGGAAIAKPFPLLLWFSEAATCAGVTADTYSGTLTAGTGILLQTITAKKTFMIQTAATGIFVGTLVASANPADQYVCVAHPITATPIASAVSGTNWEGA